jgi:Tol biopolymer transport system component
MLGACSSDRIDYDDLPNRPVAVVVRTEDDGKRLQETAKREAEEVAEAQDKLPTNDPMKKAQRLFDGLARVEKNRARYSKLVFLDPIERESERVEFAPRDARPLAWTSDRTRLLYSVEKERRPQLYEWIEASGEVRQLTWGAPHGDGTFGPNGRIAAVRRNPLRKDGDRIVGGFQIYVTDIGGANPRPVTEGPFDVAPTWSPDGTTLIYEKWDVKGTDTLRSVDVAAAEAGRFELSRPLARGRSPVFSLDGEWVIYSGRTRVGYRLFKMHPDGTGRRSLGRSGLQETDPSISPDGRYVVYTGHNSNSESGPQILVKRIDGSSPRQLQIDGSGSLPVW